MDDQSIFVEAAGFGDFRLLESLKDRVDVNGTNTKGFAALHVCYSCFISRLFYDFRVYYYFAAVPFSYLNNREVLHLTSIALLRFYWVGVLQSISLDQKATPLYFSRSLREWRQPFCKMAQIQIMVVICKEHPCSPPILMLRGL